MNRVPDEEALMAGEGEDYGDNVSFTEPLTLIV